MNTRPDTTRQRNRQATRPALVAARRWARLGRVHHYVLALPAGPLWDVAGLRDLVSQTTPHPDTYWKKERGECGGLHVHILAPLPPLALPTLPTLTYCGPLDEARGGVRGMLAYLSKPAPAEMCRPKPHSPLALDTYARHRAYCAALDEWGEARRAALADGRRRLRPMSGWVGRGRILPELPHPLLVLALLRLMVSALVAALLADQKDRGSVRHRATRRPPLHGPAVRRERPHRPPLPPPRIQGQAH